MAGSDPGRIFGSLQPLIYVWDSSRCETIRGPSKIEIRIHFRVPTQLVTYIRAYRNNKTGRNCMIVIYGKARFTVAHPLNIFPLFTSSTFWRAFIHPFIHYVFLNFYLPYKFFLLCCVIYMLSLYLFYFFPCSYSFPPFFVCLLVYFLFFNFVCLFLSIFLFNFFLFSMVASLSLSFNFSHFLSIILLLGGTR
jgi:hypothetical protein